MGLIERNRRELDLSSVRKFASPALYSLSRAFGTRLRTNARGRLLDLGCGDMPYRNVVIEQVSAYDGLDIEARTVGIKYVTSVSDMSPVPDASYETVICTELLEHVENPRYVATEIARVLVPGGRLILTVPFLGRLHEEPRDFYRYTKYGLEDMFKSAGLEVAEIVEHGSLASFLGHQISTVLIGSTWHIPLVKWMALGINLVFVVAPAVLLDAVVGPLRRKMPLGYVMVATKPRDSIDE